MTFGFQASRGARSSIVRRICAGLAFLFLFLAIHLCAQGLSTVQTGTPPVAVYLPGSPISPAPLSPITSTMDDSAKFLPPITPLSIITNPVATTSNVVELPAAKSISNSIPAEVAQLISETNGLPPTTMSAEELMVHLTKRLELARYLRTTRQPGDAEPILTELLADTSPEPIKQSALLEMAALAQDQNELTRALQIYSQFLNKWPDDLRIPEILLRQGLLFRRMGLHNLALTKFYGVMTSALVLKNDQLDYYIRLVLQAQTEIAETQFELGKYADAAEFFSRLLKQNNAAINKAQIIYKLIRCHAAMGQYADAVSEAQEFLDHYPGAPEQPEIRFQLALALKELGRNNESLQQVLQLLQEQRAVTEDHPEVWAYWQQRAGNLIANQLYHEGDYTKALEIYLNLVQLDGSTEWKLPLSYQIGMTYERLWQPQKATETYNDILSQEKELGTNASPSLKAVFDMARWRIHFIEWQDKAEAANRRVHLLESTNPPVTASLPTTPASKIP
jgi:tetratricopeptide (TPR) repeat protein